MLAIPIVQRVDSLSLALRTITVHTKRGTTINGVGVDVTSCCQVKIQGWSSPSDAGHANTVKTGVKGDLEMDLNAIRLAAQHFIGKKDHEIEDAIQKTVAGHQRAIIGVLTVEELYRDRRAFSQRVLDLIHDDMRNMGLTVVSYTVAEITDENGYIDALGVTQTELVKREATEGRSVHQSQARVRESREQAQAHTEVNRQYELQIESDMKKDIRIANAQKEIDMKRAIQEKAHAISAAEQDALLFVEQQKARAAEAKAELLVLKEKVEQKRLEKERQVNVEADALLYQAGKEAEAKIIAAKAEADRIRMEGEAAAEVIKAKGLAEIEVLKSRLSVWKEFGNHGVILEKMIEALPEIAAAVADPLKNTGKMVFIGSGEGGGGPSQFTKEMNRMVAEVPETVHALTGYDLGKGIAEMMKGNKTAVVNGAFEGMGNAVTEKVLEAKYG